MKLRSLPRSGPIRKWMGPARHEANICCAEIRAKRYPMKNSPYGHKSRFLSDRNREFKPAPQDAAPRTPELYLPVMPFTAPTGTNFRTDTDITMALLRQSLEAIAVFIQSRDSYGYLLRYDDWWQHDGLPMPKGKLSWEAFADRYENEAAIAESMPKRHEVRVGICGPGMEWYLRYIAHPSGGGASLDLTVPPEWEEDFRKVAEGLSPIAWISSPADDFYRLIRKGSDPGDGRPNRHARRGRSTGCSLWKFDGRHFLRRRLRMDLQWEDRGRVPGGAGAFYGISIVIERVLPVVADLFQGWHGLAVESPAAWSAGSPWASGRFIPSRRRLLTLSGQRKIGNHLACIGFKWLFIFPLST